MSNVDVAAGSSTASTRRWLALLVVLVAQLMVILDSSVVNVALPVIQKDLSISQANLTWVINGYLISYGSLLLVAGRLGDLFGRKPIFLAGLAIFTVASAGCGFAGSETVLIAARFAQGVGGALASAAVLAFIVADFPQAEERARAMSFYLLVTVGGGSIGLLLGGVLTEALSWHWIFAINIPIGVVTLVAGLRLLPSQPGSGAGGGVDIVGSVLVTAAAVIGIDGIVGASEHGWLSARTLGTLGVAAVLLAAFFGWESRVRNPIVPLRILRERSLIGSAAVRASVVAGLYGVFFFGSLFLEEVLHYGSIKTGIAFLPQTLVIAALSSGITTRLMGRFGPFRLLIVGLLIMIAGLGLLAWTNGDTDASYFPWLFLSLIGVGVGAGLLFMPLLVIAMKDVPAEDAGLASGVVNVSMQIAGAVGLAVLATLSANRTNGLIRSGHDPVHSLASGYRLGGLVGAGCVVVALVIALLVLRPGQLAAAATTSAPPAPPELVDAVVAGMPADVDVAAIPAQQPSDSMGGQPAKD